MSNITTVRRAKKMGLREVIRSVGWIPLLSPFKRHERSLERALPLDIVQRRPFLDGVEKWQEVVSILLLMSGPIYYILLVILFDSILKLNNLYLEALTPIMVLLGTFLWSLGIRNIIFKRDRKYASLISHSCTSTGNATLDAVFRRDVFELEDILVKNGFSKDDISILNNLVSSMEKVEKERRNMLGDGFQISLNSKCEALVMRAARACGLDNEDSDALRSLSAPLDVLSSLGISPDLTARGGNKLLADNVP